MNNNNTNKNKLKIIELDPYLTPFESDLNLRMDNYYSFKERLLGELDKNSDKLLAFANAHLFFGFHKGEKDGINGWFYREWLVNPEIKSAGLIGDFNGWNKKTHKLYKLENNNNVWEVFIPGEIAHGSRVKINIITELGEFDRIPLYCKRVIQDPQTLEFCGQIWDLNYDWRINNYSASKFKNLLIYEAHVGMCSEEEKVASFKDFTEIVLPRIKDLGYNAVQLMAVMEHPFYGSFGYQVGNFYAVSSRFGTPEDLKELIDKAHELNLAVLLDLVHSHAAPNVLDGLAKFDGTDYQFFHKGAKGSHPAWGTKLFNYGKPEVVHFLLSNLKYWLEEYKFDGFRFDGVTSMLYQDHGLGESFSDYSKYFSMNTDTESVTYLQLAAELCKKIKPDCILIAEDMSAMPGMCLPIEWGGIGFDYRLAMGMPDFWINNLKKTRDEDWNVAHMWYELNQRRPGEKVIGYAESHDQALVGDKTIMFWLADKEMYWFMNKESSSIIIDRAISLHKLIRLITCMCAGDGYLNFMGNEFGHPEWIDFPRPENNSSYHYARRLWRLADDENLKYIYLRDFDKAMINLARENNLLSFANKSIWNDEWAKTVIFTKNNLLFIFNFHVSDSYNFAKFLKPNKRYNKVLDTSWEIFGGVKRKENEFNLDLNDETAWVESRSAVVYEICDDVFVD